LLDALTKEFTGGKMTEDIGGKMMVQGCRSEEILSNLRLLPQPLENWNPRGIFPEPYLKVLVSQPKYQYSGPDILCSAGYFIAEKIADSIQGILTEISADEKESGGTEREIIVTGNGRLHGMLTNNISTLLRKQPLIPMTQLGIPAETFDALCTAMLSVMAVSHIPSSLPHLTGGDTSKTLGRITPGSIINWQRLVQEMSQNKPAARTLRSAV